MAFPPIFENVLMLVGMFVVALLIDWQVALAALASVPLLYYQIGVYSKRIVPRLRAVGQPRDERMSITHEAMQMLRLIVGSAASSTRYRRFRDQAQIANRERMKVTIHQTLFSIGVNVATAAGTALVLGLGAWHVLEGKLSVGELVVLMTYIAAVYQPLQTLTTTAADLTQQLVNLSFSTELLAEDPEIVEAPDAKAIERARGRVTFENVSFVYKGRKRTLTDISFDVQPGKRVAIVGPTGSGKSTLASLMVRFYDPDQGRILIDGNDIRELKLQSLRDQMSIVLQEPLLSLGHDRGQHPLWAARRHRGGGHRGRQGRERPRLHLEPEGRLRHRARRAGTAALRRRAAAHLRRAGIPQGRADPDPRRADVVDRLEDRERDPRCARRA